MRPRKKRTLALILIPILICTLTFGIIFAFHFNDTVDKESNLLESYDEQEYTNPIEVTNVYSFTDDFKVREFTQGSFEDKEGAYTLPYCLFLPENYSEDKQYPVLLFLHGAGEQGKDNVTQLTNMKNMFIVNGDLLKDVIILCPQALGWWDFDRNKDGDNEGWLSSAVRLLDKVCEEYSADDDRIYIMGVSMGGYGTWDALSRYPDRFAAGVPICGGGNTASASALKDIPIWIYHGTADSTVDFKNSEDMYNAITAVGGNKIHFSRLEGVNHNAWDTAMFDRELFSWLLAQNKSENKSGEYTRVPNLKIIDNNGNVFITENEVDSPYFFYGEHTVRAQFNFKDESFKNLKEALKSSDELTLIHGSQKLFSFKYTGEPQQHFVVETEF